MSWTRGTAVAGTFYPSEPDELAHMIDALLAEVPATGPAPKALIVPHAGYVYSGAIAASGYARLREARGRISRVVMLGPAHHALVKGLATSSASAFATPLGLVPLDREAIAQASTLPQVQVDDEAHRLEHSLEVHLPFLQRTIGEFWLVPFVVGVASRDRVAEVLDRMWGGAETLVVISSDLSHYHDYATARRLDTATARAIEQLEADGIGDDQACGRAPVRGLLASAKRRGLRVDTLDLRNSGDTAGSRRDVVGYGAWALS